MTKYAAGTIGLTEMIDRAPMNEPFLVPAYTKKEAHQIMRDAHGAAKRKHCKVTTDLLLGVSVEDCDSPTFRIVRIEVVERWVVE